MASIPGSQYNFFAPPGTTLNVVRTLDGEVIPPPVAGVFNLEVVALSTGTPVPLPPGGYQGFAVVSGALGQALNLITGDINVVDTGSLYGFGLGGLGNGSAI